MPLGWGKDHSDNLVALTNVFIADNDRGYAVITTFRDLQRKYLRDKEAIRSTWISLSPDQRKTVILAGARGGEEGFLRHRDDAVCQHLGF